MLPITYVHDGIIHDQGGLVYKESWKGLQIISVNTRTETVSNQLVQGAQNRISQTTTNTPDMSNQVNSLIMGTIVGAAGIAGMYAVKPSVKQFVNTATQKKVSASKKPSPKKSELDFKFSSDTQNPSDAKIVNISAIIQQTAQTTNTHIGADEATFIKPDDSPANTESSSKQTTAPKTTISSAPKDDGQKLSAQENKPLTFKEMNETQLDAADKTATQAEGTSTLFFAGPLYFAMKKSPVGKYASLALAGFQLFNKGLLMTGQIPIEQELNMDGDFGKAAWHEINTLGVGMLTTFIPVVGSAIVLADAGVSALTGTSVIEETVRVVENGAINAIDAKYNREWYSTAPKVENLENYITKLEESIQTSEPGQRRDKQVKLLQKVQKYKTEVATRKNIREFNTKMFNSEFSSFEP